jgi:hypothetical protein
MLSTSSTRSPFNGGDQLVHGFSTLLSLAIVCQHYKQSGTPETNLGSRSYTLFYKQAGTLNLTASRSGFNRRPVIATHLEITLRTIWLKRQPHLAKPIYSPPYCHASGLTSDKESTPNRKKNRKSQETAATFVRSIIHY